MNEEFRKRAFLPIFIPLAIIVVVLGVIAAIAWMLLYNTREGAAALAIVGAAGILIATSLAASHDRLSRAKQAGAAMAVLVPAVVGVAIAAGAIDIDESLLNVNAQPHEPSLVLPEVDPDAPVLAAESASSFCLPTDGGCEPTKEWNIEVDAAEELFTYTFDNRDSVTSPHNLILFELPEESAFGSAATQLGTEMLSPSEPPSIGVDTQSYRFAWPEATPPEQFYFVCSLHPTDMWGVGTITS